MSAFNCTKCGTLMQAPAPGSSGACPNCGQLFETPAVPQRFPRRDERWDEPEADDARYGRPRHLPHSGLGIASFIIGLVVVVIVLLMFLLIGVVAASRANRDTAHTMGVMTGLFVCAGAVASLVGLGLGMGGVFQGDRNRTFAVIGLILNGLILLGTAVLFLIGMAVGGAFR
jgi:hypothetical protein